jgi:hypothetical protein
MSESEDVARDFRLGMERLDSALARVERAAGGNATINVNAGGVGVLITTVCCAIVVAVNFVGAFWLMSDRAKSSADLTEIRDQLRERRDGENAIRAYINTGILKPRTDPEKK